MFCFFISLLTMSAFADEPFHFTSNGTYQKLVQINQSGKPANESLAEVKKTFCNPNARFKVKYTATYTAPSIPGALVDEVAEFRQKFLKRVRFYFKNELFFESSGISYYGAFFDRDEGDIHDQVHEQYSKRSPEFELLIKGFTMVLPVKEIARMKRMAQLDADQSGMEYFGYKDGKFSTRLALEHQDMIWKLVLSSGTTLQETAISDDKVRFSATFDPAMFCKYGVSLTDLVSK